MDERDAVQQAQDIMGAHAYRTLQAEAMMDALAFSQDDGPLSRCYGRMPDGAYTLTPEYAAARVADPAGTSRTYAWIQTPLMTEVGQQALRVDPRGVAEEFERLMLSQPPDGP